MTKRALLKAIYEIPSCIFFKDTKLRYRFASQRWKQLNDVDIIGKTDMEIRKDQDNARLATTVDKSIIEMGQGAVYTIESNIDGNVEYLEITKEPVFNRKGKVIGIVGLINDITDKVNLNKQIEKLYSIDYLTNTLNRRFGTDAINAALEDVESSKMFCLLDIDNFKQFNDKYGHQAGDIILKRVANTILESVFDKDIVMRLGGDEFVILLNNVEMDTKDIFINKLFKGIENIKIPKINKNVSVSLGITAVDKDSTFDSLYSVADRNMYKAKNEKGNYYVYN